MRSSTRFPATRKGEITIDSAQAESGTMVLLTVSDNGIGIPESFEICAEPPHWDCSSSRCSSISSAARWTFSASNPTRFALRFPLEKN